ncbi:MAG: AEC family transporter [Betaproteobacteria bacterium]
MIASALLLLPDFLLIAFGAAMKRVRVFDAPFWRGLERFVYFVLFPALLFRALATSSLPLAQSSRLVVVGLLFTAGGMLLSALARPLLSLPRPTYAACFQCAFRFNTYIALAAASRLSGAEAVAAISLLIGILVPVVNVAAVAMLAGRRGPDVVLAVARNPLVIACVAGLGWNATGIALPGVVDSTLEHVAGAALPLGLIAAGAGLEFTTGTLPLRAIVWWTAVKLAAVPALAFGLAILFGLSPIERQVAVLLAAVPTAPSSYILAMQMSGVGAPVALLITTGTLLAIVTLPLWIALVG